MLPVLGSLAGSYLAPAGVSALTAGAVGAGLGSLLQSGNLGQGILTGIGSYFGGNMYGKMGADMAGGKTFMGMSGEQLGQMAGSALTAGTLNPPQINLDNQRRETRAGRPLFDEDQLMFNRRRAAQAGPIKRMQEGGTPMMDMAPQRPPMAPQDAGIASMTRPAQLNDKELINAMVSAIKGEIQNPKMITAMFIEKFGREALMDLIDRVESGEFDANAQKSEGMLKGAGDGMDDMIPANLEGEQDVLLSSDEYIVPADVVSQLGNGSSDAGAQELDGMLDRVRKKKYGRSMQPPQMDARNLMPA